MLSLKRSVLLKYNEIAFMDNTVSALVRKTKLLAGHPKKMATLSSESIREVQLRIFYRRECLR